MTIAAATRCAATRTSLVAVSGGSATDGTHEATVSADGGRDEPAPRWLAEAVERGGEQPAEHGAEQRHLGEPEQRDHLAVDLERHAGGVGGGGDAVVTAAATTPTTRVAPRSGCVLRLEPVVADGGGDGGRHGWFPSLMAAPCALLTLSTNVPPGIDTSGEISFHSSGLGG